MTIEDTIRTEMMRLQELLGRLEDFKSRHWALNRCKHSEHDWLMKELSVSDFNEFGEAAHGEWACTACGVTMVKRYEFVGETLHDPWRDLREDEEE